VLACGPVDRRAKNQFKNQLKSKIRFLKKPDGWPGLFMYGPARTGRAFFQPGLARAGPGGPCANTYLKLQRFFIKVDRSA
jgi:hypothetical protein